MSLASGTKLGPYEIMSPLGAGGMGEVYRAQDTRLDRTVAIKVLASHLLSSPEFKQRMEREARAISSLNHPNICHLYDIGSQDGADYLVMEFLEGETLAERLRKGALPLNEILKIGVAVADALAFAHRQGIVHRDLKPGNIMLTPGRAKLMDFGLAKPLGPRNAAAGSGAAPSFTAAATLSGPSPLTPLTTAGSIIGTIQYMSPEQIEGKEADARSDIFSFGAVLYEMATGKRAFQGKSHLSTASSILEKEPDPISTVQPQAPKALEHTVQTCLAKGPDERFQNAHDLKLQLEWLAGAGGESPVAGKTPNARSAGRMWAAWAVASMAVVASLLLWVRRDAGTRPTLARFSISAPADTSFDTDSSPTLAISPDGQRLAYTVRSANSALSMLYLRRLDEFEGTPVPGSEDAAMPFFSPDGQWVGFITSSAIKKVPVEGGAVVKLASVAYSVGSATWGTDTYIYFSRFWAGLLRVPQNGGKVETVTLPDPARQEQGHRWPEVLPDGETVLFSIMKNFGANDAETGVLSIKTRTWRTVLPNASNAHYLSGHLVYVHGGTLMAVPFDLKALQVTGTPAQVLHGVLANPDDGFSNLAVSPSGNLVYINGPERTDRASSTHLVWVSRDGKESPATPTVRGYEDMSIAPDRKMAAFTIPADPVWNIWILDLERGNLNRLTFAGDNRDPLWSPDGRHIAYTSFRDGRFGLYWSAADGSSPEQRLTANQFEPSATAFTPDGKKLIFTQEVTTSNVYCWEVPVTGDATPVPLNGLCESGSLDLSPDGKWIAYESGETGQLEVYVQPYPGPGGKWQVSSGGGYRPRWSPGGKEIFYRAGDAMMAVMVETHPHFSSGTAHMLFSGRYAHAGRDYETDGRRFLMMKSTDQKGPTSLQVVLNWTRELKK
jgi:serine/threonine protein kinase/dipeptidyl aminopeptidase/acylaminoacyl peptidase